jgi:hypothetical protein
MTFPAPKLANATGLEPVRNSLKGCLLGSLHSRLYGGGPETRTRRDDLARIMWVPRPTPENVGALLHSDVDFT